jgi:hypothetical protein
MKAVAVIPGKAGSVHLAELAKPSVGGRADTSVSCAPPHRDDATIAKRDFFRF